MKRNTPHAFVNQVLIYALATLCCGGGVGLGAVWINVQNHGLANSQSADLKTIRDLNNKVQALAAEIGTENSPEVLKRRNAEMRLGLVPLQETQIHRAEGDPLMLLARRARDGVTVPDAARPRISLDLAAR